MQKIPLIYEDDEVVVIDKPAGILVHGLESGVTPLRQSSAEQGSQELGESLVDWFVETYPKLSHLDWPNPIRPGIVHRLDRDTSGVMLLAKTPTSLVDLQNQFAERTVHKIYIALVVGQPTWEEQTISASVSRAEGTKRRAGYLKLPGETSKDAETTFRVEKRFRMPSVTLLEAEPKTGRTHQIRVHLNLLELPILGDPWYHTKASRSMATQLAVPRLLLHARKLTHQHPKTGEWRTWQAPIPADFQLVLDRLKTKKEKA